VQTGNQSQSPASASSSSSYTSLWIHRNGI
jgi:hypothetical protein